MHAYRYNWDEQRRYHQNDTISLNLSFKTGKLIFIL